MQLAGQQQFSELLLNFANTEFVGANIFNCGLADIAVAHYVVGNAAGYGVVETDWRVKRTRYNFVGFQTLDRRRRGKFCHRWITQGDAANDGAGARIAYSV